MATLEIKYSIGDTVYFPTTDSKTRSEKCPDCLGTLKWLVKLPSGKEIEVNCKTCDSGLGISSGVLTTNEITPRVRTLTIGQVGFEDGQGRYMCEETSARFGSLYYENTVFSTYEEAMEAAKVKCDDCYKNIANRDFKGKYDFADKLSTLGYTRQQALKENRKMLKWLDRIK